MDVDYIQDGLSIHEGMPAGDKLGGFDAEGWRIGRHGGAATRGGWCVEWHGEAATRRDGVSGKMVGLRRAATGWDGVRAGQRGSLYFWHP